IPIHCSPLTAAILKANQDTGQSQQRDEFCYTKERQAKQGVVRAARGAMPALRPFFLTGQPRNGEDFNRLWERHPQGELEGTPPGASPGRIGPLPYRSWPLDHSLMGATAFAVETSAGWLVYTGDLRQHGRWGQRTRDFLAQAGQLEPAILLCEGTNAGEGRRVSEEEVEAHCLQAVKESRGLVVADFGPRNIERLLVFLRIAQETGRRLVLLPKDIWLLEAMRCASPDTPSPSDEPGLFLYHEGKGQRKTWEQQVLARFPRQVEPEEVGRHPEEHILCFSFWDMAKLVDVAPQGGTYVYSSSEAFTEEMAIDLDRLRAWLEHFGMRPLGLGRRRAGGGWEIPPEDLGYHASGHASGPDLLEMVKQIAPRVLVPIHTQRPSFYPENLKQNGIEVRLPRTGERMRLP
ncbi:MAG: MBL fold metallo-hydrolase RNA specificity domain-containing protein, partial [Chloroflexota bacterium]|nr:MBL fold metallo-hydrolase RNA specificity domain-containing protein [Chloroflexota bacterium]